MKAFEKWCNDQGGINGRKLKDDLQVAKKELEEALAPLLAEAPAPCPERL